VRKYSNDNLVGRKPEDEASNRILKFKLRQRKNQFAVNMICEKTISGIF
jgi:hypothetical protein